MATSLPLEKWFEEIALLTPISGVDSWGQPTVTYAETTIMGKLRMMSGNEPLIAQRDTEISTHRLYTKIEGITPLNKFSYLGRLYDVVAVNNVMGFDRLIQVDLTYER